MTLTIASPIIRASCCNCSLPMTFPRLNLGSEKHTFLSIALYISPALLIAAQTPSVTKAKINRRRWWWNSVLLATGSRWNHSRLAIADSALCPYQRSRQLRLRLPASFGRKSNYVPGIADDIPVDVVVFLETQRFNVIFRSNRETWQSRFTFLPGSYYKIISSIVANRFLPRYLHITDIANSQTLRKISFVPAFSLFLFPFLSVFLRDSIASNCESKRFRYEEKSSGITWFKTSRVCCSLFAAIC